MIKPISSGEVIALFEGQIVLAQPGGLESHWRCVEANDWLGFRNTVSGNFLGREGSCELCCAVKWHRGQERFRVRKRPDGGSV